MSYFSKLFTADFVPHGFCMRWQSDVIWLHVVSDALITLAYLTIALLLIYFVRKRKDIPYDWIFLAFATFIVACGTTHAMSIVTLWNPLYRLDGIFKAITAIASIATAICLARLLPTLFRISSPAKIQRLNQTLAREVAERKQAQEVLQEARQELEKRVEERTRELAEVNEALNRLIEEERNTVDAHRERDRQLDLTFDGARIGTFTWDLSSGLVSADGRMQKLYDLSTDADPIKVDDLFASIHPEDIDEVRFGVAQAVEKHDYLSLEFRVVHRDSSIHWLSGQGSFARNEEGEPFRLTGFNMDITARKEAQLAREEGDRQFRTLADSIPHLASIADAQGSVVWYNQRWYDYTQKSPEEMKGWGWQAVQDPKILPSVLEEWRRCIRTGEPFSMEFPIRRGDGVFNWFLNRVIPMRDRNGQVIRWFGTNTDVTEIREAREVLRDSERRFRRIADAMPQLVWVTGPDGKTEWFNQGWYDYTGLSGGVSSDVGGPMQTHPEDHDRVEQSWLQALAQGTPYQCESRRLRHDGVYRWFLGRSTPFRDDRGQIVQWIGTCTDIEEHKNAQAAIKKLSEDLAIVEATAKLLTSAARARLQAVLDAATQVSIIATDATGLVNVFNTGAEKMLQYSADEVVGLKFVTDFHLESECAERSGELLLELGRPLTGFDIVAEAARRGGYGEREWTYVRKDGTTLDVSLGVRVVHIADEDNAGFLCIASDITAPKDLERQLRFNNQRLAEETHRAEEANRAKSEFLASMSHEIRTPMNAILGMADLLGESDLDAEQRQYVDVSRRAGGNLLALINNILDLSKIESGHFELEKIEFKLDDVVERSIELTGLKANEKGLVLLSRIAPDVPMALIGDPTRLQQVLLNLLGNAMKFTERGEVVITVRNHESGQPGRLEIGVSDTGIGIAPDKLRSIFDDFAQADSSTTRKYGGTGLGLGICRRLVEFMGGTMTVESKQGEGSTFRFTATFGIGESTSRKLPAAMEDFHGRRVLVIDNNATNCLIFQETLISWGLNSSVCASAQEGFHELETAASDGHPYALVILDRQLPGTDGFDAIAGIQGRSPGTPIVMLTSDNRPGEATRCKQAGVSGYAVKPVRRSDLLRLIRHAMGQKAAPSGLPQESVAEPAVEALQILIAEDSPDNRMLLAAYLKRSPHKLTFAEDGELAVQQFKLASFGLILMDIQMPKLDGLGATRLIRAIELERGMTPTPIIALTANALTHDVEASKSAGCNAHISKPISKQKLLAALQQYGRVFHPAKDTTPILIEAPEGLEELVPDFLAARRKELPRLQELAYQREFESIRILAHNLKGNGAAYGFTQLTEIGAAMERSAKESSADLIGRQLEELSDYLARVCLVR